MLDRFLATVARNVTKLFVGVDETTKTKLVELQLAKNRFDQNWRARAAISRDTIVGSSPEKINEWIASNARLKHGVYDFTWIVDLGQDYLDFQIAWDRVVVANKLDPKTPGSWKQNPRADETFWEALHNVKRDFQKKAADNRTGFIKTLKEQVNRISNDVTDSIETRAYGNEYIGYYALCYSALDGKYQDAQNSEGNMTASDRSALAVGSLVHVVKKSKGFAEAMVKVVGTSGSDLTSVKTVVEEGLSILNVLGGLAIGLTDLVRGKEVDCRSIGHRTGFFKAKAEFIQKQTNQVKEKLNMHVRAETNFKEAFNSADDVLLKDYFENMEAERAALLKKYGIALRWLDIWKKDKRVLEVDLQNTKDSIENLMRQLFVSGDPEITAASSEMKRALDGAAVKVQAQIDRLQEKITSLETFLNGELDKLLTTEDSSTKPYQLSKMRQMQNAEAAVGTAQDIMEQRAKLGALGLDPRAKQGLAQAAASAALDRQARMKFNQLSSSSREAEVVAQKCVESAKLEDASLTQLENGGARIPEAIQVIGGPRATEILQVEEAGEAKVLSVESVFNNANKLEQMIQDPSIQVEDIPLTKVKRLINFWEGGARGVAH